MYEVTPAEKGIQQTVNDVLHRADRVIVLLGGKAGRLGESVVATALLEGTLQALKYMQRVVPVDVIVYANVAELFAERLYQESYWPDIHIIPVPLDEQAPSPVELQVDAAHTLVFDYHGAHDGTPFLQSFTEEYTLSKSITVKATGVITVLGQLFRVAIRNYAQHGPQRRYADFVEDICGLPCQSIRGADAQPKIHLSAEDHSRYSLLQEQLQLDTDGILIVCFFQSVVIAKCYERWDEVLSMLADFVRQKYPERKVDVFIACGPDAQQPDGLKQADMQADFGEQFAADDSCKTIIGSVPSLRDLAILVQQADVVLSNDTGPGHIAGALQVPTIVPFLPGNVYSATVWSSSLWHHGVTLDPSPFNFEQIKAAVIWDRTYIINSIEPADIFQQLVSGLESI